MKKVELLSPCGNFEALIAAVQAKTDAVYLSGNHFGARAYATNFNNDEMLKAINYAHLHNVKVYVTVNTLIYDDEFTQLDLYLKFLSESLVDAVIVQDLGVIKYIKNNFPHLEVHASTQLNIFNEQGALKLLEMGVKRVVLARETSLETIKKIVSTGIEVEVFIHGALCFSSSGNCLFSSVIGRRSGNRGRCAQPCRKKYSLKENEKVIVSSEALISTKDLCTIEYLKEIIDAKVTSLKIEGRMKSSEYVYTITSTYKDAIDKYYQNKDIKLDKKTLNNILVTFNREFTKGYILSDDNINITNTLTVNHQGILIGKVVFCTKDYLEILLCDEINLHDGLRVLSKDEIGLYLTKILVNNFQVKSAHKGDKVRLYIKNNASIGDKVVKTLDSKLKAEIEELLKVENNKTKIKMEISLFAYQPLTLKVKTNDNDEVTVLGDVLEFSDKILNEERIKEQLGKLTSTVYTLENVRIRTDNACFVQISSLNALRRAAIESLNALRINKKTVLQQPYSLKQHQDDVLKEIEIECVCSNELQKEVCQKLGIKNIYTLYDSYGGRITNANALMVHNLGQISSSDQVLSPYFNIVNKYSLEVVSDLGIKKCYLSPELSLEQIKALSLDNINLNVGVLAYGAVDLMVSKHCIVGKCKNVKNKNCMACRENSYTLIDEFNNEYPLILEHSNDCTMRIINNQRINLINYLKDLKEAGVSKFLLNFTNENIDEVKKVVSSFKENLIELKKINGNFFLGFLDKKVE